MSGVGFLQRNLGAMRRCRPELAGLLESHGAGGGGFRRSVDPDGRWVVAHDDATLVPGGASVESALRDALAKPAPAAIAGVGDGRVLGLIGSRPSGPHGSTHAVSLCEPDLDRLLVALDCADLSGPEGAIENPSVVWFVGPAWAERYRAVVAVDPLFPLPDIRVRLGVSDEAERVWDAAVAERRVAAGADARAARAWSDSDEVMDGGVWAGAGGRAPRVLLITSRFTTVVRHSIAAAARGFASLGWEARVCTERADHERLTPEAVVHSVGAFRPDLIVAVNYHRHHFRGLPDGVPFVCWIQDDMLHLIEPGAGARLGPRDFVMCAWAQRYIKEWGYPADRCVMIPRMTEVPALQRSERGGDDLVYVSSHSAEPRRALEFLLRAAQAGTPAARTIADAGESMIALYESGGSITHPRDIRRLLCEAAGRAGMESPDSAWLTRVTELLALHVNNPLYRQQGLAWAAQVAGRLGLSLAVYGPGWDAHPRFASYARGPLDPGAALERVTRSAGFNLRLEPYPAMCHQRLIDAIAVGGLMLSRRFGAHEAPESRLAAFYLEHLAGRVRKDAEARAMLDPDRLAELERLVAAYRAAQPHMHREVVLHMTCRYEDGSLSEYACSPHPPHFLDMLFGDAEELEGLILRLRSDADARARVIGDQHAFVARRYAYPVGLGGLISELSRRMAVTQVSASGRAS